MGDRAADQVARDLVDRALEELRGQTASGRVGRQSRARIDVSGAGVSSSVTHLRVRDTARAMSQENVEIPRRLIDAFNRGRCPAGSNCSIPTLEWYPDRWPHLDSARVYRGRDGVRQCVRAIWPGLEGFQPVDERVPSTLGDRVVVRGRWHRSRSRQRASRSRQLVAWALRDRGRQERPNGGSSRIERGPRSRGPVGVGDVAGERGGRASRLSRRGTRGTWMPFVSCFDPDVILRRPGGLAGAGAVRGPGGGHAPVAAACARPGTSTPVEPMSDFIDVGDRVVVRFTWRDLGHGPE